MYRTRLMRVVRFMLRAQFLRLSLRCRQGERCKDPSICGIKQANGNKNVFADCQWAEANDALFYVNSIADTALYNRGLFDTPLVSIKPQKVTVSKNTNPWLPFIADTPSNVFKFEKPLEFAFTPYFNLNDPSFGQPYSAQLNLYRSITFGARSRMAMLSQSLVVWRSLSCAFLSRLMPSPHFT